MSTVNKAIIIGYLGRDPELRRTQNGTSVCTFSVATTEKFRDSSGESKEETEWHRIVVWGKQADTAAEYLSKGRLVYIEGKIKTRQWEDKDGQTRYTTEIVAHQITFMPDGKSRDGKPSGGNSGNSGGGSGGGKSGGWGGGGGGNKKGSTWGAPEDFNPPDDDINM